MNFQIKKAVREQRKLRAALCGPSGSGKTYSALAIARGLLTTGRIVLIDSEEASASLYADLFDFDTLQLPDHDIGTYLQAIDAAESSGAEVIVIDSASHAWESILEKNDQATKRSNSGNSFQTWGDVGTPLYKSFLNRVLQCKTHVICTMRSKTDYVMEDYTDKSGRTRSKPVKVGLAPIFRQGGEYEFDVIGNVDLNHNLSIEKTRIDFLDGKSIHRPDSKIGTQIRDWLKGGVEAAPKKKPPTRDEQISALLVAFGKHDVNIVMLEQKIGRTLQAASDEDITTLRTLYKQISTGASIDDVFGAAKTPPDARTATRDRLKAQAEALRQTTTEEEGGSDVYGEG